MNKIAILLSGVPGSGKTTQANFLADKLGMINFDTGKYLEKILHDPANKNNKIMARERKNFDGGRLVTPSFVVDVIKKEIIHISKAGWGVVFSGSPRTAYEAEKLLPFLEKLYGKKNIYSFFIDVPLAESVKRNSRRFVCSFCGAPLLTKYYPSKKPKFCPICGGSLYKRTLDNPVSIKIRHEEYRNRTKPIFDVIKYHGYKVRKIDGRPAPYKVFQKINAYFKNGKRN
ncbi:MAG: nucleoside monophosphate kinase [Patescibacteria group bacterium]